MKGCLLPLNLFELIAYELDDSLETYNALRATHSSVKRTIDASPLKRTFFFDMDKKSWTGVYCQRVFPKGDESGYCHILVKPLNIIVTYTIGGLSLEDMLWWLYKRTQIFAFGKSRTRDELDCIINMRKELFEAIKMLPP